MTASRNQSNLLVPRQNTSLYIMSLSLFKNIIVSFETFLNIQLQEKADPVTVQTSLHVIGSTQRRLSVSM